MNNGSPKRFTSPRPENIYSITEDEPMSTDSESEFENNILLIFKLESTRGRHRGSEAKRVAVCPGEGATRGKHHMVWPK